MENVLNKEVWIKFSFEALHSWKDCNIDDVHFLKNEHRHIFHVEMIWSVSHNNRDIEFIVKKREVLRWVRETFEYQFLGSMSCEDIAEKLLIKFSANKVVVSEDNENGVIVYT